MEQSGFIKYYQALPSLSLWGLEALGLFRFEAVTIATKRAAVEWVREQAGVLEAFDYLGPTLVAAFVGPDAASLQRAADALARRFEMTSQPLGSRSLPAPPMVPDRLDWRIVEGLRYDARRTTRDLAKALSITPRMAEYRLARLVNSGAVTIRAVLDSQRQQGLIFYELELSVEPSFGPAILEKLRRRHGGRLWSVHQPSPGTLVVNLFGFMLSEPEAAALEALKIEGVLRATVYVQKESLEPSRPSWVDRRIGDASEPGGAVASATPLRRVRRS